MHKWTSAQLLTDGLNNSLRTAVSAVVSLLVARLLRLPESYWAPIATLLIAQSQIGTARTGSARRFVGVALGAIVGALFGTYFGSSVFAFGTAVFVLGVLCAMMGRTHPRLQDYLEQTAYGSASVTLAIVMLVGRSLPASIVALHRFFEVSIGIAVGLVFMILWPEREPLDNPKVKDPQNVM